MIQDVSFSRSSCAPPLTQGIKYAGSKLKLLPHILRLTRKVPARTVWDAFSGTTRVSQAFAQEGYQVISSDVSIWSEIFGQCYLLNTKKAAAYQKLIDHLNAVPGVDGWFTENYGGTANGGCSMQKDGLKKPWQIHNTRKLDGIREEIDRLSLSPVERAVALTSLILALDEVDNTLGHFVSYLQQWSERSFKEICLRVPRLFINTQQNQVRRGNVFDLTRSISADLAYFDPPYGSNNEKMPPSRVRYASYYHLWTTICLNDKPELFGKARRRADTSDIVAGSLFEEYRKDENSGRFIAVDAIERLIREAQVKWILLSYSSGGRATADELREVLSRNGKILETLSINYKKNVLAEMKWTHEWIRETDDPNQEFLFLIEKT
ncbi:MAG: DNA adenine methylase [Verrucomicrobia bacterium]|nr:DNA adenine methylase [Verrucomicrobiota bacterium]